jgi:hypothetical protein
MSDAGMSDFVAFVLVIAAIMSLGLLFRLSFRVESIAQTVDQLRPPL